MWPIYEKCRGTAISKEKQTSSYKIVWLCKWRMRRFRREGREYSGGKDEKIQEGRTRRFKREGWEDSGGKDEKIQERLLSERTLTLGKAIEIGFVYGICQEVFKVNPGTKTNETETNVHMLPERSECYCCRSTKVKIPIEKTASLRQGRYPMS